MAACSRRLYSAWRIGARFPGHKALAGRYPFMHVCRIITIGPAAIATALALAAPAGAQEWPNQPITMVQPNAAGGGGDALGRIIAPHLSDLLGRPVIVENVTGAGGMVGSARVAKAAPDGYQFVLGNTGTHAVNQSLYQKPLYNAVTDFAPVALVAQQPTVLIVRADLPVGNLKDFINYAQQNQGRMQYGSGGTGSAVHLACALLNAAAGVEITHVPFRGNAPAMQELIAGRIDYQCPTVASAIPQIKANSVKAIALLAASRSPALPDLATAQEQGLKDFDAGTWNGIFFPRGTPSDIVLKMNKATVETTAMPAVRARLRDIGFDAETADHQTPEFLQALLKAEVAKWAAAIKASRIGVQ
jgi:tripartite-type tricarboxylate transporter receptor subunit TctC